MSDLAQALMVAIWVHASVVEEGYELMDVGRGPEPRFSAFPSYEFMRAEEGCS